MISEAERFWFVMRDLKRANAKLPAYKQLCDEGHEVFTPTCWRLETKNGRRIRKKVPVIPDLLFVNSTRESLDPIVNRTATLQYRYIRGSYCQPMTVRADEMSRFIAAVNSSDNPIYHLPSELSPSMYGKRIRLIGGPLNGYEGNLLSIRGSRKKRIIVELPGVLSVGVEVQPDYIQLI